LNEPLKIYQTGPDHEGCLSDAPLFEQSAIPKELRRIRFSMRPNNFESLLNVEIYHASKKPPDEFARFSGDDITVLDIDSKNRICIGWSWSTRGGGGTYYHYAFAIATFDEARVALVLERWRKLRADSDHAHNCATALEKAGLRNEQVRTRILVLVKEHELDRASIEEQRKRVLREAELCDGSDASLARHQNFIISYPSIF